MSVRTIVALVFALFLTTALPIRAAAPTRRAAFAVVIGNNRSLGSRRPDLHYADDDAAKYFAILQTVASNNVWLLSDFDADTARLFPDAHARAVPPTRAELFRAGREIGERVRAAANAGDETEVYFVFAGHGDIDQGVGFVELADGRFNSLDLEQWLRAIPFSRAHVILDSCNSFFMFSARKPGGRYYATPEDALRSLAARLPNVGVFLSTSAEGESFEWSDIQSGIFSHVVRSGLLGAADADGDGNVSYLELAAFVATATADVPNPSMRPHVFSRGPGGRDDQAIIAGSGRAAARRFQLSDTEPMRIRLRDRESLPLLDANEEAGRTLTLTVPEAWTEGAVIEHSGSTPAGTALHLYAVPTTTTALTLASLQPVDARGAPRGPGEIFQRLFTRPFGPHAVAEYVAETSVAAPPVYGVSREDAERMNLLLGQIEGADRGQRLLGGTVGVAIGALYVSLAASAFLLDRSDPMTPKSSADTFAAVLAGLGALSGGYGIYTLARPWAGERLAADFRSALGHGDYAHAFAMANERLDEMAAVERRQRWVRGIAGGVLALGSGVALAATEFSNESAATRLDARLWCGLGAVLGVTGIASALLIESPIERLTTVWRRDPSLVHIQPTVAPIHGGATFGMAGSF